MAQGFYLTDLSLTKAIGNGRRLFLTKFPNVLNMALGYVAGTGNGIVTVAGEPAQRHPCHRFDFR